MMGRSASHARRFRLGVVADTVAVAAGGNEVTFTTDFGQQSRVDYDLTMSARSTIGAPTALTSAQDNTNGTSFTTASIAPSADKLVTLAVSVFNSGAAASVPTVTGAGMTWTQVATVDQGASLQRVLTLFRALSASPGSGALTIDLGGVTHESCCWSIHEWSNVVTSGTNGADAIVQSQTATSSATNVTTQTATLSAFEDASNVNYTAIMLGTNNAVAPGTGFTELTDAGLATDVQRLEDQYKVNDTTCDPSWTSITACSISVEIKSGST